MFLMTWRMASAKLQMCQYLPCSWLVELLLVNVMLMEVCNSFVGQCQC